MPFFHRISCQTWNYIIIITWLCQDDIKVWEWPFKNIEKFTKIQFHSKFRLKLWITGKKNQIRSKRRPEILWRSKSLEQIHQRSVCFFIRLLLPISSITFSKNGIFCAHQALHHRWDKTRNQCIHILLLYIYILCNSFQRYQVLKKHDTHAIQSLHLLGKRVVKRKRARKFFSQ